MPSRLLPYGDRAVLVELDDLDQALALHERLQALPTQLPGEPSGLLPGQPRAPVLVDVVVGARTVLLVADSARTLPGVRELAQRAMASLGVDAPVAPAPEQPPAARVVEVPVHYDGADLTDVAEL
ncbi:MAG: carboxyltransferase domain-containing protein, partial [Pedococcus sp.]